MEELWNRYFETRDVEDRDALIVHYLYLVKSVVNRIIGGLPSHVQQDDLISSGVTGLIKAVEKYDIEKNVKFESYASLLIKGAVIDEMRRLDWVPRSVQQKIQRVKQAMEFLQQKLGRDPQDSELAEYLEITPQEFEDLLHRVRPVVLLPLNAQKYQEEDEGITLSEVIADESAITSFDEADRREFAVYIEQALKTLNKQEQKVMKYYYFDEMMLKEIAKKMGITESRVSQIHTAALLRLKYQLEPVHTEIKARGYGT
jgi:RNA polymerase sigma factor FliA